MSAEDAAESRTDALHTAALEAPEGGDPGIGGLVVLLTEGQGAPVAAIDLGPWHP